MFQRSSKTSVKIVTLRSSFKKSKVLAFWGIYSFPRPKPPSTFDGRNMSHTLLVGFHDDVATLIALKGIELENLARNLQAAPVFGGRSQGVLSRL